MLNFFLVIEDDSNARELYCHWLNSQYGDRCATIGVDCLKDAKSVLEECRPDCIILDYRLLDGDGLEYMAYLKQYYGEVPKCVLFVTGIRDEAIRQKAMAAGATNFMLKHELSPQKMIQQVNKVIQAKATAYPSSD